MDRIVQNRPGSDLGGLVRVWPNTVRKQAGVHESSGPVSDRTQPVSNQFPTFRLGSVLPETSRNNIVQNQPGSDLVLADCARLWPNRSGPEASRSARIIRPASGQCFPANPDRMRIVSGMFTGMVKPPP